MNYRSFFFLRERNKTLHNAFFAPFSEECFTICLTMFYGGKTPPASVCIMPQHYECQHQCHLQKRPHQSKPHHEHLPAFYRQSPQPLCKYGNQYWDFDTQTLKTQNPAVQLRIYEQIEKYDKRIKRLEALEVPVTLDNVLETDGRRVYCTIAEYFRRTIAQLESAMPAWSVPGIQTTL